MVESTSRSVWKETGDMLRSLLDEVLAAGNFTWASDLGRQLVSEAGKKRSGNSEGILQIKVPDLRLPPDGLRVLIKYFSECLRLQNIAEDQSRIETVRARRHVNPPPNDSIEGLSKKLSGVKGNTVPRDLNATGTIVLTSHPTESTRRTILQHMRKIGLLLSDLPDSPTERSIWRDNILQEIRVLWRTPSRRVSRPTVRNEVELGLFYLRNTLTKALPEILEQLDYVANPEAGRVAEWKIASWIGGDRDGHPFVDSDTTAWTLEQHQKLAFEIYLKAMDELERTVSSDIQYISDPDGMERWIEIESQAFPGEAEQLDQRYPREPLRKMAALIQLKLAGTVSGDKRGYKNSTEFLNDINEVGMHWDPDPTKWPPEISRLIRQIRIFGFHVAALDIRQHSRVQRAALNEIITGDGSRPVDGDCLELVRSLLDHNNDWRPGSAVTSDLRAVFEVAAKYQQRWGNDGISHYLVSMVHSAEDLIIPLLLMRSVDPDLSMDIVPVFETLNDLEHATRILEDVYATPQWRSHIECRGNYMEVMLGYSDSTKDAGTISASWGIYRAQVEIASWGAGKGIKIGFFHGRGGSLGRGGVSASNAILELPAASVRNALRITHQGEVLSQMFLLPDMARRNLEMMLTAHASAVLFPSRDPEGKTVELMNQLSESAGNKYRQLIHAPGFWDYFLSVTPIREMATLNWGSRPSWREKFCWEDLRAIPWVFSWTQNRMLIPGWYGAGSALEIALKSEETNQILKNLYQTWPFMTSMIHNLELALVKADLRAAASYQRLAESQLVDRFWPIIVEEYDKLRKSILEITGGRELLEKQPDLREVIAWRNPHVDPLNFLQIELLEQYRSGHSQETLPFLEQTMEGIALGLRTTG